MKLVHTDHLLEMANIRGKDMKREDIHFSFFFSRKYPNHAPRIKICWNREKMTHDTGNLEIHGDYAYTQDSSCRYKPDTVDIATARYFAKKYKVLFTAVWEEKLDPNDLIDWFRGRIDWKELIGCFVNIDQTMSRLLLRVAPSVSNLERFVREHNLWNLYD